MSLAHRLGFAAVACLLAAPLPAGAALIMHKDLSLDIAKTIAEGAIAACNAKGYGTSAVVVDRDGRRWWRCAPTPPRRTPWRTRGARPTPR